MLTYHDGKTFTWTAGRRLASATDGETVITYAYDGDGNRIRKTVNGETTEYEYIDGKLLSLKKGADVLRFLYDETDTVYGFLYNGDVCYYVFNLQGDITGIRKADGWDAASYSYDAWGNPTGIYDDYTTLATLNPFRYRGYFYDEETGFYYLQSRYYDPEVGRFINADGVMGVNSDMTTYNLFAYCGNNPVVRYDNTGMFWRELIYGVIHEANSYAIEIGIDTAAIGAFFLMMKKDDAGVYHAAFNCWQQYFGYNDLYDMAFDLATSMNRKKFPFSYGGNGYTIWAWKGDYINLGAGAELGIYRGDSGHRTVDKGLAMWMTMQLFYNGTCIFEYYPGEDQWWITGFNPAYQNINAADLTVIIGVGFYDSGMYQAFKDQYMGGGYWSFIDCLEIAILQF